MSTQNHTYQPLVILFNDEDYESKINELTSNFNSNLPLPSIVVLDSDNGRVVTFSNMITIDYDDVSHDDYVDLGLESGNQWASCNLGAAYPYESGKFYQWGSLYGYSDIDDIAYHSNWTTAPFNGGLNNFSKTYHNYYKSYAYPDGELVKDYDAAYVLTDGEAKLPTAADVAELIDSTINCWCVYQVDDEYILGRYIINDEKSIFIPAAGYVKYKYQRYGRCVTWTSDTYEHYVDKAHCMSFKHDNFYLDNFYKYFSMPIRPIKTQG